MPDYTFITSRLATGAAIVDDKDVLCLVEAGITHVIDNRSEFDDTALLATHPDISYLFNGTPDDGQPKDLSWFSKGIEFGLDALTKPYTKVYSHCAAGRNRGPSMAYAILRAWGLDMNTAENMIRILRPQVTLAYKLDAERAVRLLGYDDSNPVSAFGEIERD